MRSYDKIRIMQNIHSLLTFPKGKGERVFPGWRRKE